MHTIPRTIHPPRRRRCRLPGKAFRPLLEELEPRLVLSTNLLTYHNDLARTGANLTESILTPAHVNSSQFGKLFSYGVDGQVYAQPLYLSDVTLPDQTTHNIVYVATQHDSVYAFDADTNDPDLGGGQLWQTTFIDPDNGVAPMPSTDSGSADITPEIGITGTPVIDPGDPNIPDSGTLYVVAKTKEMIDSTAHYVQRLHALSLLTGTEKLGAPVIIGDTTGTNTNVSDIAVPGTGDGSVGGVATFNARRENQRPGLVLSGGVVYVSWASHGDTSFYHGWVVGYDAQTLALVSMVNLTPNASKGGIWMSGGAPAVDDAGNLYFATGNGTFDVTGSRQFAYGDSVVKLAPDGQTIADYFTPFNQAQLESADLDLGSGGVMLLPDSAGSADHPHLMVQAGKQGTIYLLDRDDLGQYQRCGPTCDDVVQSLPNAIQGWTFCTPAFFNGKIYFSGTSSRLKAFAIADGQITSTPVSETNQVFNHRGGTPSISANDTENGIAWILEVGGSLAVLQAYDAENLATELYNTNQAPDGRDHLGPSVKFTVPTIANGHVYAGTRNSVDVLGLLDPGWYQPRRPGRGAPANILLAAWTTEGRDSSGPAPYVPAGTLSSRSSTEPISALELGVRPAQSHGQNSDTVLGVRVRRHEATDKEVLDSLFRLQNLFEIL